MPVAPAVLQKHPPDVFDDETTKNKKETTRRRRHVSRFEHRSVVRQGTDLEQSDLVILGQHSKTGDPFRELDNTSNRR